ncbi:MAG: DUF3422 domain-containing protein [Rhizobiales bacterium]|nr:DUF3422 domain-containing protein [Hyphomicrobiales bacterium]
MRSQTELPQHPLRQKVLDEIHARPFEPMRAPGVILKYVFWRTPEIDAANVLAIWCKARNLKKPLKSDRRFAWKDGTAQLVFESHTEFVSLTWFGDPGHVPEHDPFSVFGGPAPVMGVLINAVRVDVRIFGGASIAAKPAGVHAVDDSESDNLFRDFDPSSLCVSKCFKGQALIATDFRQDEFGLTRFLVVDMGMRAMNCGALVRRIGEIETYRTVALLGLPEAQRASPIVTKLEKELSDIFIELNTVKTTAENQNILNQLYRIAMDLEALMIDSQFRFAASRAYLGIVEQRLKALGEEEHLSYVTFRIFLLRRVTPAIQTCDAVERRQSALAEKITRASDLLRTQLDIDLQAQNQGLLKALNERSEMQFRLQQTVEGLSVVAISYYAVSLLYYVFRGFAEPLHLSLNLMVAASVPLVATLVWLAIRRLRHGPIKRKNRDAENGNADKA